MHSGMKTYGCELCGKSFLDSLRLRMHLLSHSGRPSPTRSPQLFNLCLLLKWRCSPGLSQTGQKVPLRGPEGGSSAANHRPDSSPSAPGLINALHASSLCSFLALEAEVFCYIALFHPVTANNRQHSGEGSHDHRSSSPQIGHLSERA